MDEPTWASLLQVNADLLFAFLGLNQVGSSMASYDSRLRAARSLARIAETASIPARVYAHIPLVVSL